MIQLFLFKKKKKPLNFHVKIGRFSLRNHKIAEKFEDFLKKICRFIQENLMVSTGKCEDFCIKIGWSLQKHLTI